MRPFGYGSLVAGASLLATGLAWDWASPAVAGAGILVLLGGSLAYVLRRPRLAVERSLGGPRVQKGDPVRASVKVTNLASRRRGAVTLEQQAGQERIVLPLPALDPEQSVVVDAALPTAARGRLTVAPVELVREDPFGFCRTVQRLGPAEELLVGPRVSRLRPVPLGASHILEGPSSDTAPQGTVSFHRLREYVAGDDLRSVHWASTARHGRLMVRHHVDTAQPYTVVVLDVQADGYAPGAFEEAVDVAASVVTAMAAGRSPVQVRTSAGDRVGGPNHCDATALLDFLTDVTSSASSSVESEVGRLGRERGGTVLVLVTGRLGFSLLPAATGLRRRFGRVIVLSLSGAGAGGPGPTRPAVGIPGPPGVTVLQAATAAEVARAWDATVAVVR